MADWQITCINKTDRTSPHERISRVGGGSGWRKSIDEVIRLIDAGTDTFWVSVNGRRTDVVVDEHNGRKYIRTRPDDYRQNNLLSLPECS
jgi:Protein of unknown function (DUF3892)